MASQAEARSRGSVKFLDVVFRPLKRFSRRSTWTKIRTLGVILAIVGGTLVYVVVSPSGSGTSTNANAGLYAGSASDGFTPVTDASTSTRGLTRHSINVVFPVVSLQALAAEEGFAGDIEFTQQSEAIYTFVNQINATGGINGRKIDPIVVNFDPTNSAGMRALCKTWTEGSPAAFAVIDGVGAWQGSNELCITQEGHTPFIGQWSTVTNWTRLGSPYLWWTSPDQAVILSTVVHWGLSSGLIARNKLVGIIAGNRTSDQLALNQYLLPDLKRAGIKPVVETIAANPSQSATTGAQAPLVIQSLRSAGVQSVIPLIPFNVFFPLLQAETQQNYFPKLLLSDYESSIQVALGLIPIPYEKALNGQEGVTTMTLGGVDDPRPQRDGGYDPGVRKCWTIWHRAHPKTPPGQTSPYIEAQGPIVGWCQAIYLFAAAAKAAGPDLNRRSFVEAMAGIRNFAGTYSPTLSYSPHKFYGPTEYRVVRLHNNNPRHNACKLTYDGIAQGTCWQVIQGWRPLKSG